MMYDRCHIADGCEGDEACAALCPESDRMRADIARRSVPAAADDCQHAVCVRVAGAWLCAFCQATVPDEF